uniref:Uncharacterized protein n=1 Tax=Echinococcus granulosus TaxID=6210 RepID=A0A068WT37_ECHGR|nr:hypothetical protein EgrG_002037700 [Echinococcus granulosus]
MYRRPVKKGSLPAYWSRKALQHEYQLSWGTGKARNGEASGVTYDPKTQQPQKETKFKTPYSGSLLLTSKLDEPTLSLPLYFKRLKVNLLSSKGHCLTNGVESTGLWLLDVRRHIRSPDAYQIDGGTSSRSQPVARLSASTLAVVVMPGSQSRWPFLSVSLSLDA